MDRLTSKQSFTDFAELAYSNFSGWSTFNLDKALRVIRSAIEQDDVFIFLVADELAAAVDHLKDEAKIAAVSLFLTDIGNSLDNDRDGKFDALVTTVDQIVFASCTWKSHRYFDWIQLTG